MSDTVTCLLCHKEVMHLHYSEISGQNMCDNCLHAEFQKTWGSIDDFLQAEELQRRHGDRE